MHRALEIPEILLNIFGNCVPYCTMTKYIDIRTVATLARTCRAFKEPALDVLWSDMDDPSPLARCVPEASYHRQITLLAKRYSFSGPLTQIEWEILRSYARRILYMAVYPHGHELDWRSVNTFLIPAATEPLFPNLRRLDFWRLDQLEYLSSMPFPSLTSFSVSMSFTDKKHLHYFQPALESLCKLSPNVRNVLVKGHDEKIAPSKFSLSFVCQLQNLQALRLHSIPMDANTLAHLSRMPALTCLDFELHVSLLNQPLPTHPFSTLRYFTLHSDSLHPISRLLSLIRLPAITDFTATIRYWPPVQHLSSFWDSVQTFCNGHTIQGLELIQTHSSDSDTSDDGYSDDDTSDDGASDGDIPDDTSVDEVCFEALQPCIAFGNLRRLRFSTTQKVCLTDSELLALASGWPHLKELVINGSHGWKTPDGITPDGLGQLLQTCRSLHSVAISLDTRGYTKFAPPSTSLGYTLPSKFSIDVLDSTIEPESVPAMAAFFASIAPPHANFFLWNLWTTKTYVDRWREVHTMVKEAIRQRS